MYEGLIYEMSVMEQMTYEGGGVSAMRMCTRNACHKREQKEDLFR